MKRIIIILTTIIFIGCSTDKYDIINKESANAIFNPFFDEFKKEAEKRGYNFSDYEIEFYLADIAEEEESAVGGLATSNNEIIIDRNYWNLIDSNHKAFLIFHELGHSILNRKHTNRHTGNQECLSFMRNRISSDKCQLNYYSELWKELYFDELFDQNTSLPFWYRNNKAYNFNYENKDFLVQELKNENRSYQMDIDLDTISNFVFEVTFENWESASERNPFRNTKVNLNGINYESNPNRNAIYIADNEYSKRYFSKWDYNYEESIKLTIRRNDGIYSFFIDKNLVHITDINRLETESINVDFSPGTNKDIVLFKFD